MGEKKMLIQLYLFSNTYCVNSPLKYCRQIFGPDWVTPLAGFLHGWQDLLQAFHGVSVTVVL